MFPIITFMNWICVSLFILGFIGNLLGLIVFSSRRFRCCSTYSTLALTSFTINLICIIRYSFLLHSTTRRWLSDHFVGVHWLNCKIYRSSSSVRVIAAWVTVFWVIERFVYVSSRLNLMFKQKLHCYYIDHYRYPLMIIFCSIMIFLITGPTVFFYSPIMISVNETFSVVQCTYDEQKISPFWHHYFSDLFFGFNYQTIRFLFSELIPSMLVAIFNIGIIICIIRTTAHVRRRRRESRYNTQLSTSTITGLTSKVVIPMQICDTSQGHSSISRYSTKNLTLPMKSIPLGKMSWMNIILILHSFLFFLSSTVTSLVYFSTSDLMLAYGISVIILGNCSLNFYIYCLSGEQFRTELKRIAFRYLRHIHKRFFRRCAPLRPRHQASSRHRKDPFYPLTRPQVDVQSPIIRKDRV